MNQQPYQKASQEILRQSQTPFKAAGRVASTAIGVTGLAGGGAILSKILPFLSKFIPTDMAIKGISKVNPKIGKFVETSVSQGHPIEEVFSFLKEKAGVKSEDFAQNDEEAQMEPQQQQQKTSQKQSMVDQEANRFQEHYGQKENNKSNEALLASLNKILSM